MQILVVGCGSIGKRHLRNLKQLGQNDLLVYRSRREDVEEIEQEFGCTSVFDLDTALSRTDAVIIANPTSLHLPVSLEAARAGCDLFIEKPLSHSLDGIDELVSVVQSHHLMVQVAYNLRFHPALHAIRGLLHDGVLGDIWGCRAWVGQYLPDWQPGRDYRGGYMTRRELGGGVVLTLSHEIDYLRWLFGEVEQVSASIGQPANLEMNSESWADISLRFVSGIMANLHLDCLRRMPHRGVEIIGSNGTLNGDLMTSEIVLNLVNESEPRRLHVPLADPNQTYLDEMANFLESVEQRTEPAVPLREGIATLRVAVAAIESSMETRRNMTYA